MASRILDLHCGMWDLVPRPGIKPRPPALGVCVLVTGLPGKSLKLILNLPFLLKSSQAPSHRISQLHLLRFPSTLYKHPLNHELPYCIIIVCLHDSFSCDLLMGTIISLKSVISLIHFDILCL